MYLELIVLLLTIGISEQERKASPYNSLDFDTVNKRFFNDDDAKKLLGIAQDIVKPETHGRVKDIIKKRFSNASDERISLLATLYILGVFSNIHTSDYGFYKSVITPELLYKAIKDGQAFVPLESRERNATKTEVQDYLAQILSVICNQERDNFFISELYLVYGNSLMSFHFIEEYIVYPAISKVTRYLDNIQDALKKNSETLQIIRDNVFLLIEGISRNKFKHDKEKFKRLVDFFRKQHFLTLFHGAVLGRVLLLGRPVHEPELTFNDLVTQMDELEKQIIAADATVRKETFPSKRIEDAAREELRKSPEQSNYEKAKSILNHLRLISLDKLVVIVYDETENLENHVVMGIPREHMRVFRESGRCVAVFRPTVHKKENRQMIYNITGFPVSHWESNKLHDFLKSHHDNSDLSNVLYAFDEKYRFKGHMFAVRNKNPSVYAEEIHEGIKASDVFHSESYIHAWTPLHPRRDYIHCYFIF